MYRNENTELIYFFALLKYTITYMLPVFKKPNRSGTDGQNLHICLLCKRNKFEFALIVCQHYRLNELSKIMFDKLF